MVSSQQRNPKRYLLSYIVMIGKEDMDIPFKENLKI
jgi:hypothetical protein